MNLRTRNKKRGGAFFGRRPGSAKQPTLLRSSAARTSSAASNPSATRSSSATRGQPTSLGSSAASNPSSTRSSSATRGQPTSLGSSAASNLPKNIYTIKENISTRPLARIGTRPLGTRENRRQGLTNNYISDIKNRINREQKELENFYGFPVRISKPSPSGKISIERMYPTDSPNSLFFKQNNSGKNSKKEKTLSPTSPSATNIDPNKQLLFNPNNGTFYTSVSIEQNALAQKASEQKLAKELAKERAKEAVNRAKKEALKKNPRGVRVGHF